jgi:transposase-like protein
MPKNKVQFQRGMGLREFMDKYGTVEQCEQALYAWRWPQGFVCPECGHTAYCALKSRRLIQCNGCRRQTSITAGTIFAGSKLPLSVWFLAMHLITQAKNGISSLELSRQLGISQNSAWLMKHKLMQAMLEREAGRQLAKVWCNWTTPTGAAGVGATSAGAARAARRHSWQRWKPMRRDSRAA